MSDGAEDEIDPATLAELERVAAEEGTTPERVLNLALGLYLDLPKAARDVLERIEGRSDADDLIRLQWEFERAALRALARIRHARAERPAPRA